MEGSAMSAIFVDPFIRGYTSFNQDVSVFDFGDVIVANNYKQNSRVRLVSGGTCNHIQYVGKGMLTASVQGPGLQQPSPNSILRTIRELSVDHVKGILVIVQATSADLLNFGVAVEKANNEDLRASLLGVADDCQNKDLPKTERRGLAGVLLVNKIAGALAALDKLLSVISDYCEKVIHNLMSNSINVNYMLVTRECVYCKKCAKEIPSTPGNIDKSPKKSILKRIMFVDVLSEVITSLFNGITANETFSFDPEVSLVLLVNNMGAMDQKHEYIFFKECMEYLNQHNVKIARFYIGSYLELDYDVDLTLTVLKVFDDNVLPLLDYQCTVPGWKPVLQYEPYISLDNIIPGCLKRKGRPSPPTKGPKLREKAMNVVQLCLQFACDALISCERLINKMDSDKGDGDTGTRLKYIADLLNRRACSKNLNFAYPFTFFLSLSKLLENATGGTLGCIYSIMFQAAANKFGEYSEDDEVTGQMWLEALENSCAAVKKYGNVQVGDKTMYDPLHACARVTRKFMEPPCIISAFGIGVEKAEEEAQKTNRPGRKYPDSGAHAVGIWLRAVYEGVKLRCVE